MDTDSYADVVERLFGEFDWALSLPEIAKLVGRCRQLGTGSTELEGLENEARQRLTDMSLLARADPLPGFSVRDALVSQAPEVEKATLEPA